MSVPRICASIKSRKMPDVQCQLKAKHGEFCSRHWKHPTRFIKPRVNDSICYKRSNHTAAKKIQAAWRRAAPFIRLVHQGPAATYRTLSMNTTELYSLESVTTIPMVYYFSFVDSRHNLWCFDIRSLGQILSVGTLRENPYTREPLTERVIKRIMARITWLRKRRWLVFYPTGADLTSEQMWKQKILDLFMKIESFGYYVSCEWFHSMTIQDHQTFYVTLYNLWNFRLGLTAQDRNTIVPGHTMKAGNNKLFRYLPGQLKEYENKPIHWWEKVNLYLIESFLTRAAEKESQKLGAMYCVMGFVEVNEDAAAVFPWFVET